MNEPTNLKEIWDELPEIEKKMCTLVVGQHIPFELYEVYTDLNNRIKKLEEKMEGDENASQNNSI